MAFKDNFVQLQLQSLNMIIAFFLFTIIGFATSLV